MRNYFISIALLNVLVVLVIIGGFVIGGTPASQRDRVLDNTRLSDFSTIKYRIEDYYRTNRELPSALSQLIGKLSLQDPETKENYTYIVISSTSYKLCTKFSTDSERETDEYYYTYSSNQQKHKKGYDCVLYNISDYITNPRTQNYYSTPTPVPTINPLSYSVLRSCNLALDTLSTSEIKIMGIYELSDSVLFTTNKLVNASVEHWSDAEQKQNPASEYFYASSVFDTKERGSTFRKVMGYRIKIFDASGNKASSDSYIFEGNRTVVNDPRCLSLSPTLYPAPPLPSS